MTGDHGMSSEHRSGFLESFEVYAFKGRNSLPIVIKFCTNIHLFSSLNKSFSQKNPIKFTLVGGKLGFPRNVEFMKPLGVILGKFLFISFTVQNDFCYNTSEILTYLCFFSYSLVLLFIKKIVLWLVLVWALMQISRLLCQIPHLCPNLSK